MALLACCLSREQREQWERNNAIEQELKAQKREDSKRVKLLLLGIRGAGKSTFIKQLRAIHAEWLDSERLQYKRFIYQSVYVAIYNLIHAMTKLQVSYQSARS